MARPQLTAEEIDSFREAACRAGLSIIQTDGVDALTLRSLGHRLGCSYAKPYRYFGDKPQLLEPEIEARCGATEHVGARSQRAWVSEDGEQEGLLKQARG